MGINLARIQAICFDVDGTLSDTDDVWTEQLARAMLPLARLFPGGDPSHAARRLILTAETPGNLAYTFLDWMGLDDELGRIFNFLARRRAGIQPGHFRLMAGVSDVLPLLAEHYPLAVISARDERSTLAFLDSFELRLHFDCIATAQTCRHTKPYPDPLLWAAEQMKVDPSACLMIGDTPVDIRMARACGAQSIGVLCGFGEEYELRRAGADEILPTTAEIEPMLLA
jgi:phosphoglycolate phosphatase-like HAD superfamily hydrolase